MMIASYRRVALDLWIPRHRRTITPYRHELSLTMPLTAPPLVWAYYDRAKECLRHYRRLLDKDNYRRLLDKDNYEPAKSGYAYEAGNSWFEQWQSSTQIGFQLCAADHAAPLAGLGPSRLGGQMAIALGKILAMAPYHVRVGSGLCPVTPASAHWPAASVVMLGARQGS